ncbi:MAG: VWA domain-containing protein [Planctomycetes bacterium]|nr:VWA domain-containing protein [Planctomycetota bacterium]
MIRLYHTEMLFLLWLLPLLLAGFIYAGYQRRQALERFAEVNLLPLLNTSVSIARRRWKAGLLLAGFAFCAFSATRPAWNPVPQELQRHGRDVVFVLDVSRSMLAEDLRPNRLERAKLAIRDCIEKLQGDRVGLIAFAGHGVVKCPLTLDYGFFRMMLEDISPESVPHGGTMIGDAIRTAITEVFDDLEKKHKDIILITDGEDQGSFPKEAAADAGSRGIRIIAIGIGDEAQGKRIPIMDESGRKSFLMDKGEEVWSILKADTLRDMANATPGGRYLNVATGTIYLDEVYQDLIAGAEKKELESTTIKRYEEKYQIFLAAAFGLLCIEVVISERKRKI